MLFICGWTWGLRPDTQCYLLECVNQQHEPPVSGDDLRIRVSDIRVVISQVLLISIGYEIITTVPSKSAPFFQVPIYELGVFLNWIRWESPSPEYR